jgi:hypothetical protein
MKTQRQEIATLRLDKLRTYYLKIRLSDPAKLKKLLRLAVRLDTRLHPEVAK